MKKIMSAMPVNCHTRMIVPNQQTEINMEVNGSTLDNTLVSTAEI